MRTNARINFDDTIVYTAVLDKNRLAVCDKTGNFFTLDLYSEKREHSFNFKNAYLHIEKETISFSPDGKYIAYSEKDKSVVRVIDIHAKKLHHSFPTAQNKVETLCFDPHSNYLIAGCVTGRVFLWNLFSTGQVSRLSSFPEYTPNILSKPKINYVSYACFSESGRLVATTGYGGSIVITNIHTEVSSKRITPNNVRINALCFAEEEILCAGNIEGGIDIINVHSAQIIKHFQTGLGNVNGLVTSKSSRYLIASGHGKHLSLIDLKNMKLIDSDYILLPSKVTSISITKNDILIVGCENGTVNIYELFPQDKLRMYLDTNAFKQAYALLHEYPLLKDSSYIQELDDIWNEHISEAVAKVEAKKSEEVARVLKNFANVPSKVAIVNDFQSLISNFERFKLAVSHKNLALAYSMAEHIPLLKRTSIYLEMEDTWNSSFLKAQAYVIQDNTHSLFKILEPYSKVNSKLCFIQVLLHQPELFLQFVNFINTHEYDKIFAIANKYPCLKEIESFQNILLNVEDLYEKGKRHIYTGEHDLAELELVELGHIPYMKRKKEELTQLLSLSKRFENFYSQGKLLSCYELIDTNPKLNAFKSVQQLEQSWNEKMKEAEKKALLGHTKEIKSILGELLGLKSRAQKVGTLLRLSYLTQIKLLIIKRQIDSVPKAIDKYIEIFSYDTELHNLIVKIKKDNIVEISLTPEQELRRPRSLWLNLTQGHISDTVLH